jgi:uncharacterized flavoprotein (TIGR03862 family)
MTETKTSSTDGIEEREGGHSRMVGRIAVIGAGPAGLMAAERIASAGHAVDVFDAMPSVARKFLLAGVGGMNITHAEDYAQFVLRYRDAAEHLRPLLDEFKPDALRQWIHQLGIATFEGSSGRVFPVEMKAAPLLRAWLHRLRQQGVVFHPRHRWTGWQRDAQGINWQFINPAGEQHYRFDAVVLALGGASWPQLGSEGAWTALLPQFGIAVAPLKASNCGFELPWSGFIKERFAGTPIKQVRLSVTDCNGHSESKIGEFEVTAYGVEGSLIYALSAPLRELILHSPAKARLVLDWLPHSSDAEIATKLRQLRKGMSLANALRSKLHLPAICSALLREGGATPNVHEPDALAKLLKAMPLPLATATRPIAEVISCAGGVAFSAVNEALMLNALPGVFVAGEMLNWEAPTGGYLLTACFATGKRAGDGVVSWVRS